MSPSILFQFCIDRFVIVYLAVGNHAILIIVELQEEGHVGRVRVGIDDGESLMSHGPFGSTFTITAVSLAVENATASRVPSIWPPMDHGARGSSQCVLVIQQGRGGRRAAVRGGPDVVHGG
eukprot:scaffold191612_cov23-Cyclotella_meneghiniana.AAC.1